MNNYESINERIYRADSSWIFQWLPAQYNTFHDFAMGKRTEPWRANQHFNRMKTGDIALLWKAGSGKDEQAGEAGIYGVACLISEPYKTPSDKYAKYRVNLEYFFLLPRPLLKSQISTHPELNSLASRVVQGSNFRVTEKEWAELKTILFSFAGDVEIGPQGSMPDRKTVAGMQFVRDYAMVSRIKERVQHRCQICGLQIQVKGGGYYSEGHHIRPLGNDHQGTDEEGNIIILCPNHHVEFNYLAMAINPTSLKVLHMDHKNSFHGKGLAYIRSLRKEFLEYHYELFKGKSN